MKKIILSLSFLLILSDACYSQSGYKTKKEVKYKVDIGASAMSGFFLRSNRNENNAKGLGFNFTLSKPKSMFRLSTQYSRFSTFHMAPTWKKIKAWSMETNLEMLAHFEHIKPILYPFAGISLNASSGLFTGVQDYAGLTHYYAPNTIIKNRDIGLNLGLGLEYTIKHITLFTSYKMIFGRSDKRVTITQANFSAGLKFNFGIYQKAKDDKKENKGFFRRLFFPGNRYGWVN